ncbi:LIM and calponin homology domains-containing protein 1 isoform 2-T2 [Rhinophrynus dorsalis]
MASPALGLQEIAQPQESLPDSACKEAQKWIEQVTGRSFGDKDFRTGLENGILLCELLNAIKPGLVKKINRLPTPIAGLDNITLFLRGCKELGLKESQLFDPGDLQDTSNRTVRTTDCTRKLRNVLVTIYWLGKAANSCTSYSGNNLDLKEFEGMLAQIRKENEEIESPKRSIRDSGYIDCWDSERSDSLSPPRHGRDDSFDSLDSFGSRSQQTPSPDVVLRGSSDGRGSDSESDLPHRRLPDVRKDDMSARRVSFGENKAFVPFNQYLPNKNNQTAYIPAPLRKKKAEREDCRRSWSTATSPLGGERPFRFSPRSALSDDAESMSMCDMRYEEDGCMLPHSRAHHENLQNVNDLLKEEDDTWQDDLARWKTRRRSASQDLIKKEQERKKMERLLSGEEDLFERRKSIKTYKEIVEEKERREKELHEAYKNAKSKEEAEKILQKYIERFTISEAVLEQLMMPKILEKSHSVETSLLTSSDPNPLKYLRQQSLPTPKYTATVEATISPSSKSDSKVLTNATSPSKNIVSKTVPMLTAKPYTQPKNTQQVLKTFKVDGKANMNGETINGMEEQKESVFGKRTFVPPLTRSQRFEGIARVDAPVPEVKQDIACIELSLSKSHVQNSITALKGFSQETNHTSQEDEMDSSPKNEFVQSGRQVPEDNTQAPNMTQDVPVVTSLQFTPSVPANESALNGKISEEERKVEAKELIMHWSLDTDIKEQKDSILSPFKRVPEGEQGFSQKEHYGEAECSENSPALIPTLNSPNRLCSWDPEEERRRQERWQQEQERMLQERYQKEQEKLKDEWEKAQKEVEEEERKYYEEERKIIEDTVVPLTFTPNTSVPISGSERSEKSIPVIEEHDQSQKENNNEKIWTEPERQLNDGTQEQDGSKMLLLAQEGTTQRAEEVQTKGKTNVSRLETEQSMIVMNKEREQENHVPANDCSTTTGLTMQMDQHVMSSEKSLPEKDGSPNNYIDENIVQQSMSSTVTRGTGSQGGVPCSSPSATSQCQSPNRSVSGKKLCSTCGCPLGKGAAMIIETLSLYFHIQCFKCGICKEQLGDATTGTDVRIRNGLLNCNDCYMKSRTAGHPTPL